MKQAIDFIGMNQREKNPKFFRANVPFSPLLNSGLHTRQAVAPLLQPHPSLLLCYFGHRVSLFAKVGMGCDPYHNAQLSSVGMESH
jgi:hypothetical protein